jgi:HD-GYP domain-containing protein (c-di-GMP phosphodiesterase class II)
MEEAAGFIPVRRSQIPFYRETPLFRRTRNGDYVLYKAEGVHLDLRRLREDRFPALFLRSADRLGAIQELQTGFTLELEKHIRSRQPAAIKNTLCELVAETLTEPRAGALYLLPNTVELLIQEFAEQPAILRSLTDISFKDYTTAIHSVNVMALTLGFCFYRGYPVEKTRTYGLAALLHDIGKTRVPTELLTAPRKLTDAEFALVKAHPRLGRDLLERESGIQDPLVLAAADEHHERLDGTGYPDRRREITPIGRLLSIIDAYEALTNEDRPYRRAARPIDALTLLKVEADMGKFDPKKLHRFSYSLI